MRILILGSGGREHAISWKLSSEIGWENVFICPGNAGTAECGTNLDYQMNDFENILAFCHKEEIDVILPGSEEPIAHGIRDYAEAENSAVFIFSPDKFAAQLESSKAFAKEFMNRHAIPTAAYATFQKQQLNEAYTYLESLTAPYVLKADGLAAGKGVLILDSLESAKAELQAMFDGKFGAASESVVIEEFLDGLEFSVFVITDGEEYILLPEAKDYKRIGEGDSGLNTGGMGAVSPVPFFDEALKERTIHEIIKPSIAGLKKEKLRYRGFMFFGLIEVGGAPKVIEYNVRMGDPETEVVIPRMNESLSDIVHDIMDGNLRSRECSSVTDYCSTVVSVSGGYPEAYEKNKLISINGRHETLFHAGTKRLKDELLTNGGRVFAASAFGNSLELALKNSYHLSDSFEFEGRYFRRDIGQDLIRKKENGSI